ncbi:MAG: hypothetical protein K2X41_14250 [Hyphomicrobium sp.]|nr:hypothetical protein [Hyphomicrobium sp.]
MIGDRIASAPPIVVVAVFGITLAFLELLAANTSGGFQQSVRSMGIVFPSTFVVAWSFGLFNLARRSRRTRPKFWPAIFGLALLFLLISIPVNSQVLAALEMGRQPQIPIVMLVAAALVMVCVGLATSAFLNATGADNSPFRLVPFGVTAVAIYFLPIGIWFLRNRIAAIASADAIGESDIR